MIKTFQHIINQGESETIEFKTAFSDEVIISLVAFANTKGGVVYIGVDNNGSIKGVDIGKETVQNWVNEIKIKTQPSIIPSVDILAEENKQVVCIQVNEFPIKPLSFKGRYYKRIGNSNHQLSVSEISDVYTETMQYSWDAYNSSRYNYSDLDEQKILNFINRVNGNGRFLLVGNPKECLTKLKFVDDDKVTNAAILLFAKEEISHNVHIGRLKTPTLIIDDRMIKKTLFETVDEIMKYIVSQIKFAFEIKGYPTQRIEIPEYPIEAIRETVLNAVIHRDYLSPYDIQIKIFDKEITIYNPGKLSGNLTFEDLQTDNYQAYARNKLIAEAFYLTGDIEKYGSGFRRVREYVETYPTMITEFREVPNGLLFTYSYTIQKNATKPPYYTPEMHKDKVEEDDKKKNNKVTDKVTDRVTDRVTEIQGYILENIRQEPHITSKKLSEKIGISAVKIRVNILKLKELGYIERIGSTKAGYWKLIDGSEMHKDKVEEDDKKKNNKVTDRVTNKVTDRVTEIQGYILENIRQEPHITSKKLSENIGISAVKIRVNILKLKELGYIERIGSTKSGYWKVIQK